MIFSISDQLKFAKLSQDFNPLHCDEVLSRRYIFGAPVVHGINALIMGIKEWSNKDISSFVIKELRCKFNKPMYLDDEIIFDINDSNGKIIINIIQSDQIKLRANLRIDKKRINYLPESSYDSRTLSKPSNKPFEKLKDVSKTLDCSIDINLANKIYTKEFVRSIGAGQLAEIISFSRIVGMHIPGLNSIFSEIRFYNHKKEKKKDIDFEVTSTDERFKIINIESNGPVFHSNIKAFYRPQLVEQKTVKQISKYVTSGEFDSFRALIIGGSRGLGEFTAKVLGYGGAKLMITYANGKKDALKVVKDIKQYNNNIQPYNLDISKLKNSDFESIKKFNPSHVFYFATPFIFNGVKDQFCKKKYDKFEHFYVNFFELLVGNLAKNKFEDISYFYPSTTAINENLSDMLEYTMAKKKGEDLCSILEDRHPNIRILRPRLPRLETDQTVSLSSVTNHDPLIILKILRSMKK